MMTRRRIGVNLAVLAGLALLFVPGGVRPAAAAPCITIFIAAPDELGFRNGCGVCKIAVWNWGGGQAVFSLNGKVHSVFKGGNTHVSNYEVGAYSELRVRSEAATGQLIDEEVCAYDHGAAPRN